MNKIMELTDLEVTHVSYVNKAANRKEFLFMKADDIEPVFEKEVEVFINKANEEQKLVYGIIYEPDVTDTQGDFANAESIEKAAHKFLADSRNIDLQHNFQKGFGTVVESYIAPADFSIGETEVKKGSWVLVTKASDEVWESIKKGEITGYSMAGKAKKIEKEEVTKKAFNESEDDVKSFFNVVKSFFTGSKIEKQISKGEDDMKKDEIQELIRSSIGEALKPINTKLDGLSGKKESKKDEDKKSENESGVTKAELETIIKSTIAEVIEPINTKISNIEKAKGIPRQLDTVPTEPIKKSVFAGLDL